MALKRLSAAHHKAFCLFQILVGTTEDPKYCIYFIVITYMCKDPVCFGLMVRKQGSFFATKGTTYGPFVAHYQFPQTCDHNFPRRCLYTFEFKTNISINSKTGKSWKKKKVTFGTLFSTGSKNLITVQTHDIT